jgi:hypothetical protein
MDMRIWQSIISLLLAVGLASTAAAGTPNAHQRQPDGARASGAVWLVEHQHQDGGWGAGTFGQDGHDAVADVATTSLAVMALMRDASGRPIHRESIERGVLFVVRAVEASPLEGARLQGPDGTQPQYKLGRNVDTHLAALMLGGATASMSGDLRTRADTAYDKVLTKVVAAQRSDGSFDGDGWAPVLSSSVAAQSLYVARDLGKPISPEALEKADDYQRGLVDAESGAFDSREGAGVDLYAAASGLRGNSNAATRSDGKSRDRAEAAADAAARAVRTDADRLISGFGSVGGEEMLSYMMISDTMAEQGGDDWKTWESRIGNHLVSTQNADGSWSGHHCITSTTFVTAAAVMTLGAADAMHAEEVHPSRAHNPGVATR